MGAFNLGDCKISYFHIHLQLLAQFFFVAALFAQCFFSFFIEVWGCILRNESVIYDLRTIRIHLLEHF